MKPGSRRIIAVANQKGGVGKTTTAVNLAHNLACASNKVLLIDLDPQGNATSSLGASKDPEGGTIKMLLTKNAEIGSTIQETSYPNLFLSSAAYNLKEVEESLNQSPDRSSRFHEAFGAASNSWDYVIIDCPPSLGLLTRNALAVCGGVLIPIQPEFLALEGLAQMSEAVRVIRKEFNPQLRIEGVLLTMFEARLDLHQQVAEEVRQFFKEEIFTTVIPRDVTLAEAPSYALPILEYQSRSSGAVAYALLTHELQSRLSQAVDQAA